MYLLHIRLGLRIRPSKLECIWISKSSVVDLQMESSVQLCRVRSQECISCLVWIEYEFVYLDQAWCACMWTFCCLYVAVVVTLSAQMSCVLGRVWGVILKSVDEDAPWEMLVVQALLTWWTCNESYDDIRCVLYAVYFIVLIVKCICFWYRCNSCLIIHIIVLFCGWIGLACEMFFWLK